MKPGGIDRQHMGREAEERAAQFLVDAGYAILWRNYRCRRGEIDIVAGAGNVPGSLPAGVLVIAEVRLRTRSDYGGAAASVTPAKRRRIVRTARHLLACNPAIARLPVRFDVLLVPPHGGQIQWLRAAFEAG